MNILQNYLKVAIRNLLRQKTHSLINILGLSTGICFSFLISLYVLFELSYDNFHTKGDRIYLLPMTWHFNGTDLPTGANCSVGASFMKETFPQVEETVRILNSSLSLRKDNEMINEASVYLADSTFFSVFTFPFLVGNPEESLVRPYSIVLTENMALKYFGENWMQTDILSQTLAGPGNKVYSITGVTRNVPANSHLKFDFVVSFTSHPGAYRQPSWDNSEFYTYLALHPSTDIQKLVEETPAKLESRFGAWAKEGVELDLVPLNDIYLHNPLYKVPNISTVLYVRIFAGIALLILIVATFNYINLSTARSMERALEVGVRKVMGAFRTQLFYQFMSESIIITTLSLLIGICLTYLAIPVFTFIVGKTLDITVLLTINNVLLIVLLCVVISLTAGIYPALVLSNYQPVKVLKGKLKDSVAGIRLRRRLVIIQFSISIVLIISALTISSQLKFMRLKDSGYNRDKVVSLALDSLARTRVDVFKNRTGSEPWVNSLSAVTQLPVNITFETALSVGGSDERKLMRVAPVDADYLETLGVAPIAGTGFTKDAHNLRDAWEIIVNESAVKFFGWTREEALGKELTVWQNKGVVKGVVSDFHFSSLHNPIEPLVIFTGKNLLLSNLLIRLSNDYDDNPQESLKKIWSEVNPDSPFMLTYLTDRYEVLYKSEAMMSTIVNLFALLAAFISGLGLFGLASYSILQRTKELGIRKVLGASVTEIVRMVSGSFVKQVAVAFLLAAPTSYFLMTRWLSAFQYKIDFNWVLVILAGFAAVLIALITVAYHSLRVARNNPVDSLRAE